MLHTCAPRSRPLVVKQTRLFAAGWVLRGRPLLLEGFTLGNALRSTFPSSALSRPLRTPAPFSLSQHIAHTVAPHSRVFSLVAAPRRALWSPRVSLWDAPPPDVLPAFFWRTAPPRAVPPPQRVLRVLHARCPPHTVSGTLWFTSRARAPSHTSATSSGSSRSASPRTPPCF